MCRKTSNQRWSLKPRRDPSPPPSAAQHGLNLNLGVHNSPGNAKSKSQSLPPATHPQLSLSVHSVQHGIKRMRKSPECNTNHSIRRLGSPPDQTNLESSTLPGSMHYLVKNSRLPRFLRKSLIFGAHSKRLLTIRDISLRILRITKHLPQIPANPGSPAGASCNKSKNPCVARLNFFRRR